MIKVVNRLDGGQVSDDSVVGNPCIELGVSFSKPNLGDDSKFRCDEPFTYTWGLLDTGADLTLVSEHLIPPNAVVYEKRINHTPSGTTEVPVFIVTFHIREADHYYTAPCMSMSHREGRAYDLLLGRIFLKNTRFIYDRHNGISEIEWVQG